MTGATKGAAVSLQMYDPATESLSRREVLDRQWSLLERQFQRLYNTNPFYQRRLRAAGATPEKVTSLRAFRELVPTCTKKDLLADQTEYPPYGSRLGVAPDEVVQVFLTSGTTGLGQEVYGHTRGDVVAGGSSLLEGPFFWAGWRPGHRVFSMTPIATLAFGLVAQEAFRLAGYQAFQVFVQDSLARLRLMERFSVEGMVLTPALLARLTAICREHDIDPRAAYPGLRAIVIAGQSYPIEMIEGAEDSWGAKVFDLYGSSQGNGSIAATCEYGALHGGQRMGMHVLEHRNLLEVVDPQTGEQVKAGEEGMGIITNLAIEGSPLLRFRTDDKMRYLDEASCPCGRATGLIESGTLSRYDDMMKVRGMNIWPQTIDDVVFGRPGVDEYTGRVYVDDRGLEQIEIRYALKPVANLRDDERTALARELVTRLKDRINVTCQVSEVERSALPIFEFKAVRWVDSRQADLQKHVW